jgi:ArsR family transcriptional regulator
MMELTLGYAPIFKALGDETRLKIVEILSCGELCACDILESFEITQPTLSYHMKILTECGLVLSRKEGSWIRYSINTELIALVNEFWDSITTEHEDCICMNSKEDGRCD